MGLPTDRRVSRKRKIPPWEDADRFTHPQRVAILATLRASRFIGGHEPLEIAKEVAWEHMGANNLPYLYEKGLGHHFMKMKEDVLRKNVLSEVLLLSSVNEDQDTFFCRYETEEGVVIRISARSCCQRLLSDYFTGDEIDGICREMPSYNTYAEYVKEHSSSLEGSSASS